MCMMVVYIDSRLNRSIVFHSCVHVRFKRLADSYGCKTAQWIMFPAFLHHPGQFLQRLMVKGVQQDEIDLIFSTAKRKERGAFFKVFSKLRIKGPFKFVCTTKTGRV